jgi:hypothetical protein
VAHGTGGVSSSTAPALAVTHRRHGDTAPYRGVIHRRHRGPVRTRVTRRARDSR